MHIVEQLVEEYYVSEKIDPVSDILSLKGCFVVLLKSTVYSK